METGLLDCSIAQRTVQVTRPVSASLPAFARWLPDRRDVLARESEWRGSPGYPPGAPVPFVAARSGRYRFPRRRSGRCTPTPCLRTPGRGAVAPVRDTWAAGPDG